MKKILVLTLMSICYLTSFAQNQNEAAYDYFIEVNLEWGGKSWIPVVSVADKNDEYIYDEQGEKLRFKSRSELINYFTKLGWSFEHSIRNNNSDVFFLKKKLKNDEDAKNGLKFKDNIKKK